MSWRRKEPGHQQPWYLLWGTESVRPHTIRVNTLRLRCNGCNFVDIFKVIFFNENVCEFWLKYHWSLFWGGPIENIPALVQIMTWCWKGNKPSYIYMYIQSTYGLIYWCIYASHGFEVFICWFSCRKHNVNNIYIYIYTFLHAKPWIPGGEKSIFMVVIY